MSRLEYQPQSSSDDNVEKNEELSVESSRYQRLSMPTETTEAETTSEASAEEETPEARERYVDQLLRNAPLLAVPLGFADRVMTALKKRVIPPNYQEGIGFVMALGVIACLILPLLAISVNFFVRIIIDTEERDSSARDFESAVEVLGDAIQQSPIVVIVIGVIILVGLAVLMSYLVRFVRGILVHAQKHPDQTSNTKGTLSL